MSSQKDDEKAKKTEGMRVVSLSHWRPKSWHALVVLAIILVLIGGVASWYVLRTKPKSKEATTAALKLAVNTANTQADLHQFDTAEKTLNSFIADSKGDTQSTFAALLQLGTVYLNAKQYKQAFDTFTQAEKINGKASVETAEGRGMAAEALHNDQEAINSYKDAVRLLKARNAQGLDTGFIDYYETKIKDLGGTP